MLMKTKQTLALLLAAAPLTLGLAGSALTLQDGEKTTITVERAQIEALLDELERLRDANAELQRQIANLKLEHSQERRELQELRQFIEDRREFGDDFEQYRQVKEIAQREERRRQFEAMQRQREEEARQRQQQGGERDAQKAEEERLAAYRRAGFAPVGFDVFLGKMGYFYGTQGQSNVGIEYEPGIGLFYEPVNVPRRIDYSRMKLSGAVLNASNEVRNIGVAIAFFDAAGNQIGAETVQIQNARPNVPYPFTATLDMASGQAFASSSQWVLFADPVE